MECGHARNCSTGKWRCRIASEILLKDVAKRYGDGESGVLAIENVSFRILPGEFFAILGPSGCGKSTIINMVAGFIPVSSGSILVGQLPVGAPGPDRVVVSQDYSLFSWKTVGENVEFGLKARGVSSQERRNIARKFLELVHLSDVEDRYPGELSGGMRQRLALARALAVEPACLLLDEPLASLDMQMRNRLQDEMLNIWHQTKQTVMLVTHDLDEAIYMSDHVLVMGSRPGKLCAIVSVRLPRPRRPEMRLTDEFQAQKREVSQHLVGPRP
jgi:NitT/TauT family transport system ATP-binding protein